MSAKKDIEDFLSIQTAKVRSNVEIVAMDSKPQPFMLHLTKDQSNKEYIPRIGTKQGHTEDRTLPRITVADTLLGCMIGYAVVEDDFFNRTNNPELKALVVSGYRINRLDCEYCFRPNARLVYDVQASNEHWLVTYNKDTLVHKPIMAGRLFIYAITVTNHPDKGRVDPDSTIVGFVEVKEKQGIYLTPKIHLPYGHHTFTVLYNRHTTFDMVKNIDCTQITKAEFDKREVYRPSLEMLNPPAFIDW